MIQMYFFLNNFLFDAIFFIYFYFNNKKNSLLIFHIYFLKYFKLFVI